MVISFLHKTFVQPNVRAMAEPELASKLADHLYALREISGEDGIPQTRRAVSRRLGFRRKELAAQILPAQLATNRITI